MAFSAFLRRRVIAAPARVAVSLLGSLAAPLFFGMPALAQDQPGPSLSLDLDVVAKQLDIARNQIQPRLGASVYEFRRKRSRTNRKATTHRSTRCCCRPRAVAQDSFGQLHVRGDHANLQFRLNGVQLPEGINVFGQALATRLANSVALITGALPAQYGFRTAGIIDIQTKTGTIDPGGSVTMYGGSHSWVQPSFEWGGRVGQLDYFITGEFLHNTIGIENPTSSYHPIHDETNQYRGFAYLSGIIDPTARITGIFGTSRSQFQIPNTPGLMPGLGLTVNGISDFDSAQLNENQRQITHYGVVALQEKLGPMDFQLSAFSRYSSLYFTPDPLGDLLFNGISRDRLSPQHRDRIAARRQLSGKSRPHRAHRLFPPGRALDFEHQLAGIADRRGRGADFRDAARDPRTQAARPAGSAASMCKTNGRCCPV